MVRGQQRRTRDLRLPLPRAPEDQKGGVPRAPHGEPSCRKSAHGSPPFLL